VEVERLRKPDYRYQEGFSEPLDDSGNPLATRDQIAIARDVYLSSKFPCKIITGKNNRQPADDIDEKIRRLQNSLWRQRMEKYRKG
jgi:hypothetical protein